MNFLRRRTHAAGWLLTGSALLVLASGMAAAGDLEARCGDGPVDIDTLSGDRKVRLKDLAVPGGITLVDYYAEWCASCRTLGPKIENLLKKYENVAVRRIDVGTYESEAARQAISRFGMNGLPFVMILDDRGKVLGKVFGDRIDEIETVVRDHTRPRCLSEGTQSL